MEKYYPDWSKIYKFTWGESKPIQGLLEDFLGQNLTNDTSLKNFMNKLGFQELSITTGTYTEQGSFGMAYINATYNRKTVVVKKLLDPTDIHVFFLESVLQCILYNYTERNKCEIRVPEIYAFGQWLGAPVIVMRQVNGENWSSKNSTKRIMTIVRGLKQLQKDFNFVHRDFHAGNVLFDGDTPYMIDFGRTCIKDFNANTPLYVKSPTFYKTVCTNKSHDICTLVVSLAPYIISVKGMAKNICNAYRNLVKKSRNPDYDLDSGFSEHHWKDEIFHFHYIMALEDVELKDFTPEALLKCRTTQLQFYLKF
jgi:tRNA A-37 threonylcarbamoyl transferase component Bud32